MSSLASLLPAVDGLFSQVDWISVLQLAAIVALAILVIGGLFRAVFGKGSALTRSVSAVLSIFLIYLTAIVLYVFAPSLRQSITLLPFITVTQTKFSLWDLAFLSDDLLFPSLLQLAILSFIVNTLESYLPEGKKFASWYLWRMVTVLAALGLYVGICTLVRMFLPDLFGHWAKILIVGFWVLILATAILKLLMTVILAAINPIVGALYGFFFANPFGKQFSKSILTTVLAYAVFYFLNYYGLNQFAFADFTLASYGPACVILIFVLYLFGKLL